MRCLLRKAYVAAAVQDGKFVQELSDRHIGRSARHCIWRCPRDSKGGIEFRQGKELAGSDDRGFCNEDFMESLELPLGVRPVHDRSARDRWNRCAADLRRSRHDSARLHRSAPGAGGCHVAYRKLYKVCSAAPSLLARTMDSGSLARSSSRLRHGPLKPGPRVQVECAFL
jgi:hypothetical protein